MDYTEKQLHSELIFDGKVLHLYRDDILLPAGKTGYREYCKHGKIYFVKKWFFRHFYSPVIIK